MSAARSGLLVIGKSGQLASALRASEPSAACLGRGDVDVLSLESLRAAIAVYEPRAVINAAAYTAVDRAEGEREPAMALNVVAPRNLARVCADAGVPLVHVSTDYVFDGEDAPYAEAAPVNPLNVYGETKARGEQAALAQGGRVSIVRASWVFSEIGNNFVSTMLQLAKDRAEIDVVADVTGRPTSAHALAEACLGVGGAMARDKSVGGLFHFANDGEATWSVLAEAIMDEARVRGWKAARIRPIPAADYPTKARRPRDSRMATGKIEQLLGQTPPHWRVALGDVLDRSQDRPPLILPLR